MFDRLDQHPDLVAETFGFLSQLLRVRPWDVPAEKSPGPAGAVRKGDSYGYRRNRKAVALTLEDFVDRVIPDERSAERWFVEWRRPEGVRCPGCDSGNIARAVDPQTAALSVPRLPL